MTTIAVCQIDVLPGDIQGNFENVIENLRTAGDEGADIVVFPELCLSGFLFDHVKKAKKCSLASGDPLFLTIQECCASYGIIAVVGFIEKANGEYFNTAAIILPGYAPLLYRKVHLSALGADQFVKKGDLGFPVFNLPMANIGLNICYDQRFPESCRSLALKGADIVIVPASEFSGYHQMMDVIPRARAYENRIYYVLANRIGRDNDRDYCGSSCIVNPRGELLSVASKDREEILFATIDKTLAQDKRVAVKPGLSEMDLFGDRVPEYYGAITRQNRRQQIKCG